MAEFAQDMRFKVDLDSGLVPQSLRTILVQGDAYANRIVTELTRDGKPFEAEGMTVVGAFMRPGDEARIDLEGAMENGEASVTLTDTCYEVSGQYTLDIILVQGEKRRTVLRIVGAVERRGNGQIVISGTLTNIDETLEEIRAAVENAETVKNELQTFSDTHIAEIEQKGQQTMTAIEQKAAQTLETIPEEYTALDAEVKSLKDHKADVEYINLFDGDTVFGECYGSAGNISNAANGERAVSFIPVEAGQLYSWSKADRIMVSTYDANKTHIERITMYAGQNQTSEYTFGENVAFVRLSRYDAKFTAQFMFVKGEYPLAYIAHIKTLPRKYLKAAGQLERNVVWMGDSISKLKPLPEMAGALLQAKFNDVTIHNVAIPGAVFYAHKTQAYADLGFIGLSNAIVSGDYTTVDAAVVSLGNNARMVESVATLKGIDFNDVTDVVLMYGTNDFTQGNLIADFKTGVQTALEAFITAYPHLRFYIISPPWREDAGRYYANNLRLNDYVTAEKEIAEAYNLPFYDLLHSCNINKLNMNAFLSADLLHPNDAGNVLLAQKCAAFIDSN